MRRNANGEWVPGRIITAGWNDTPTPIPVDEFGEMVKRLQRTAGLRPDVYEAMFGRADDPPPS